MTHERTAEFAKDLAYETLLQEANAVVDGWGEHPGATPARPTLFVIGAPRSGTTLLYQLLANSGDYTYPSNLIARFYRSPAWGARTQRLLLPALSRGEMTFTSRAGNTDDWWGPHEFGYFWEHHFDFSEHHEPGPSDLAPLVRAVAAFESEGGRPVLFKNPILAFVLGQLAEALPQARFLWVKRPHLQVAASIYRTRARFFGDPSAWLSLKPVDAPMGASAAAQIAHQLARAQEAMERLRADHGDRVAEVDYEAVCADPEGALRQAAALAGVPATLDRIPGPFTVSTVDLDASVRRELEAALRDRPELDPGTL